MRLAIKTDNPRNWPAWNMDYDQETRAPRAIVGGPAKIRIVENGPARVAVEVARETEGSKFVQTIRLSAGDAGNRVEIGNVIDWKTKEANLKAVFPLTASNPNATYNWDIGTIERPTDQERQFEVASHQWFDLTDKSGAYGVTMLSDCKIASDKPEPTTRCASRWCARPASAAATTTRARRTWGHHEFVFGLARPRRRLAAGADRLAGAAPERAADGVREPEARRRAGQDLLARQREQPAMRVLALKKAEQSDEVVVRLVELDGKGAQNVQVAFPASQHHRRARSQRRGRAGGAGDRDRRQAGDLLLRVPAAHLRAETARRPRSCPRITSQPVKLALRSRRSRATTRPRRWADSRPTARPFRRR